MKKIKCVQKPIEISKKCLTCLNKRLGYTCCLKGLIQTAKFRCYAFQSGEHTSKIMLQRVPNLFQDEFSVISDDKIIGVNIPQKLIIKSIKLHRKSNKKENLGSITAEI